MKTKLALLTATCVLAASALYMVPTFAAGDTGSDAVATDTDNSTATTSSSSSDDAAASTTDGTSTSSDDTATSDDDY